jgi:hypothetical protein
VVCATITQRGRALLGAAAAAVAADVRDRLPEPGPEVARAVREYLLAVIRAFGEEDPGEQRAE